MELKSSQMSEKCTEIIENIFKKAHQCNEKTRSPPIFWSYAFDFVLTNFEHLINIPIKNEEMFIKLSHLLLFQISVVETHSWQISPYHPSLENVDVLFSWLQKNIQGQLAERLNKDFTAEHDKYLLSIFEEKRSDAFVEKATNYKVHLLRWLKTHRR